jgi:hypothetical protein
VDEKASEGEGGTACAGRGATSLNFGQVRKELRRLVGVAPAFPEALRPSLSDAPNRPVADRWKRRPRLRPGSPAWSYLSGQRRVPASILTAAAEADIVRDGPFRSAWFAHHSGDGEVSHVEIRGPDYKGSLRGGTKTLFRFGRAGKGVCVTEAPIDALSLAAIDGRRTDTLYVATGGGIGPGTVSALQGAMRVIDDVPSARLVAATDTNRTRVAAPNGLPKLPPKPAFPSSDCGRKERLT